jgi:hypothetical protein
MASSFGAGAGADMLQEILRQKFTEAITKQKLAEEIRQANMRDAIQQGELGLGQQRVDLGRDELTQRGKQFDVSSGQKQQEIDLDKGMQPVRIANINAQTSELQRKPQAEQEQREFVTGRDKTQHGYRIREIGASRVASGGDSGQYTSVQQVVGPDGKPAMVVVDRRAGTARPIDMPQGFEPNRPARPVTGAERQTLNYFNRMLEAERQARKVEETLGGGDLAAQQYAPGWLENWLQSKEGQAYTQAQRTYTEARLRKESGAAIPPNEFETDRKTNFRIAGDAPDLLPQKRGSRLTTLRGLGNASGRALQEFYGENVTLDDLLKEFADQQGGSKGGGPKVGDVKTFPNGRKAAWDGRGWVAQ